MTDNSSSGLWQRASGVDFAQSTIFRRPKSPPGRWAKSGAEPRGGAGDCRVAGIPPVPPASIAPRLGPPSRGRYREGGEPVAGSGLRAPIGFAGALGNGLDPEVGFGQTVAAMARQKPPPPEPESAGFQNSPFDALSSAGLPPGPSEAALAPAKPKKSRGRVDILRQKGGRGGKTVTVVTNFVGIGLPEKERLAKQMQKSCGVGGTVKEGRIEIQGDKREEVARILEEAGFRPVFAGG